MSEPAPAATEREPQAKVRRNAIWSVTGAGVQAGAQFAIMIGLARLEPADAVGAYTGPYALGLAITAPVLMMSGLQLRQLLATDHAGRHPIDSYVKLRFGTTAGALAVIAVIVLAVGYRPSTAWAILAVALWKAVGMASDLAHGVLQRAENLKAVSISMSLRAIVVAAAMLAVSHWSGSVGWGALGAGLGATLVLLFLDLPWSRSAARRAAPSAAESQSAPHGIRSLATRALPLGLAMMIISLTANMPRYFVERYFGESALGVFAAMVYIVVGGSIVVAAVGSAALPTLSRLHNEGDRRRFGSLTAGLVGIFAILGAALVLVAITAGADVLTLLYSPAYAQEADSFITVAVGGVFLYVASALGTAATASQRIKRQPVAVGAVCLVAFAACASLIPDGGIAGACQAYLIAAIASVPFYGALLLLEPDTPCPQSSP